MPLMRYNILSQSCIGEDRQLCFCGFKINIIDGLYCFYAFTGDKTQKVFCFSGQSKERVCAMSACICDHILKFGNTISQNHLRESRHIYSFDVVGDKDELFRFLGQKVTGQGYGARYG